ncbi:MAG: hypothetical protein H0T96_07940 [Thermoleophilaceae bacterium]|nr:hypothetical protein [Thermoleophilaceae bacterium]
MAALTDWERQAVLDPVPSPDTPLQTLLAVSVEASRRRLVWMAALADAALRRRRAEEVAPWRYEETIAGREQPS